MKYFEKERKITHPLRDFKIIFTAVVSLQLISFLIVFYSLNWSLTPGATIKCISSTLFISAALFANLIDLDIETKAKKKYYKLILYYIMLSIVFFSFFTFKVI